MNSTRPYRRSLSLVTIGALSAAGIIATAQGVSAAPSTTVMINEVYGGGGNAGATYRRDFIELQNRGSATVDLDGWSV
jgi:predicted extracellular nuclease